MAQDDYYYEIQLTNKQLVFYFMAGATGLILSFLAGVMVGRGVDTEVEGARARGVPVQEERVVPEESPRAESATADLNYARRLEGERHDEGLEGAGAAPARARAAAPTRAPAPPSAPPARPSPATPSAAAATPAARAAAPARSPEPARAGRAAAPAAARAGTFAIQVGAFKERKAAETVAARLKAKGFPAYVASPDGAPRGLFNVRVGAYSARSDAELVEARLRDHEKFKPFIVRN